MGKSDPYVFSWYKKNLPKFDAKNIAILGSTTESFVRDVYPNSKIDLFDIQMKNWNINDNVWKINENAYDLVVCTRCAFFSKNPQEFIRKSKTLLRNHGILFVDWGMGDHWRFKDYKVGWVKNSEHEFAYAPDNFLWSTIWSNNFLMNEQVQIFMQRIKNYGYSDLEAAIKSECPSIFYLDEKSDLTQSLVKTDALALWEENPQLYILSIFQERA